VPLDRVVLLAHPVVASSVYGPGICHRFDFTAELGAVDGLHQVRRLGRAERDQLWSALTDDDRAPSGEDSQPSGFDVVKRELTPTFHPNSHVVPNQRVMHAEIATSATHFAHGAMAGAGADDHERPSCFRAWAQVGRSEAGYMKRVITCHG
jgi:hypothetical protein